VRRATLQTASQLARSPLPSYRADWRSHCAALYRSASIPIRSVVASAAAANPMN